MALKMRPVEVGPLVGEAFDVPSHFLNNYESRESASAPRRRRVVPETATVGGGQPLMPNAATDTRTSIIA